MKIEIKSEENPPPTPSKTSSENPPRAALGNAEDDLPLAVLHGLSPLDLRRRSPDFNALSTNRPGRKREKP
jgi:hypothetical protein